MNCGEIFGISNVIGEVILLDVLTETVVAIRNPYDFLWVNFINLFPKLVALIFLLIINYLKNLINFL